MVWILNAVDSFLLSVYALYETVFHTVFIIVVLMQTTSERCAHRSVFSKNTHEHNGPRFAPVVYSQQGRVAFCGHLGEERSVRASRIGIDIVVRTILLRHQFDDPKQRPWISLYKTSVSSVSPSIILSKPSAEQ